MKLEQPYPGEQLTLELVGRESLVWQGDDCKHVSAKRPGKICMKTTIVKVAKVI